MVSLKYSLGDVSKSISGKPKEVLWLYKELESYSLEVDEQHQELLSKVKNLTEGLNTAGKKINELLLADHVNKLNEGVDNNVKEK